MRVTRGPVVLRTVDARKPLQTKAAYSKALLMLAIVDELGRPPPAPRVLDF